MLQTTGDDVATLLRGIEQGTFVPRVAQRHAMTDALQAPLASRGGHVRGRLVIDVQASSAA